MKKIIYIIGFLFIAAEVFSQNNSSRNQSSAKEKTSAKTTGNKSVEPKNHYVDKKQNHFQQNQNNNLKSNVRQITPERKKGSSQK